MKIENALADPVNVCDQCKIGQKSTKHLVVLEGTQILRNRCPDCCYYGLYIVSHTNMHV